MFEVFGEVVWANERAEGSSVLLLKAAGKGGEGGWAMNRSVWCEIAGLAITAMTNLTDIQVLSETAAPNGP